MLHLLTSLVLRVDSCNSAVLIYLPTSTIAPLQRIQHIAARLVLGLDRRAHITPAMKILHWLPVRRWITFKIAILMHRILHHACSTYLYDLVHFVNTDFNWSRLDRSATTRAATTVRTQTKFGDRAFLATWQLKTYLFKETFDC